MAVLVEDPHNPDPAVDLLFPGSWQGELKVSLHVFSYFEWSKTEVLHVLHGGRQPYKGLKSQENAPCQSVGVTFLARTIRELN